MKKTGQTKGSNSRMVAAFTFPELRFISIYKNPNQAAIKLFDNKNKGSHIYQCLKGNVKKVNDFTFIHVDNNEISIELIKLLKEKIIKRNVITRKVQKNTKSLAINLPKEFTDKLKIERGDIMEFKEYQGSIILTKKK